MTFTTLLLSALIFLALATPSLSKFTHTYRGIAHDGVQTCISVSTFTPLNITARHNCRLAFECVMQSIPSQNQSILSSGSAILGFIPTVLLLLGNNNEDLIRISARFPLLAFFLCITNVNKPSGRSTAPSPPPSRNSSSSLSLGPYGHVPAPLSTAASTRLGSTAVIWTHVLAAAGAAVVVWQTVDLGRKAVVTWACWTDFYPLIWVSLAVVHHACAVLFLRLSLRVSSHAKTSPRKSSSPRSSPQALRLRSGLRVYNLVRDDQRVEVRHMRVLRWSKAAADLLNNLNFLYGTAIFSSLTLVSGRNAITVLTVYWSVAVASRGIAAWVVEMDDDVETK